MQVAGKEVLQYTVSPEESGLSYPLQVIVYQPRKGEAPQGQGCFVRARRGVCDFG